MQIMWAIQPDISTSALLNIGKHLVEAHGQLGNPKESQFRILRKWQTKFECLIDEMLFIKEINSSLNTQADSIRAKLFV